jgi:hypothetical protein
LKTDRLTDHGCAVVLFGIVFVTAGLKMKPETEKRCVMADEEEKSATPAATPPEATPSATPTATPAANDVPSLIAAPQVVDLTEKKSGQPMRGVPSSLKEQPAKKKP